MGWKSLAKSFLLRRGIVLSRPPGQFNIFAIKLRQLKQRGLEIALAVDGGAADGDWARELKGVYPEAQVLCIEPRDAAQPALRQLAGAMSGLHLAQTLVGAREGTVVLHEHGDQSSMLAGPAGNTFGRNVEAPMTTLDQLVRRMKLPWPDFIKLDLQGAELQALTGAPECLAHGQAVMLEVSFIPLQKDNPLLADVVGFMHERGYRCYDVLALWHRPLDGALAQGDFLFLREGHALLQDPRWSREGIA
jgi:FkbM family methyltransferase